ncbi:hypothetical protein MARPO_0023s0067 [Marchantia polymorpha]|uniref:Uncharacterized protein n=1 Tax=Marchantia polymorpha TaxID=3197 RepID=A0A2R6XCA0_MARPO|nr:hypothetical protein MARPO_0023s0067 [Marchantia polymorpha]|eukprot:PTQ43738.1 hypothetical protein MARPO_0023s0067 [Marchantia polymorpha]
MTRAGGDPAVAAGVVGPCSHSHCAACCRNIRGGAGGGGRVGGSGGPERGLARMSRTRRGVGAGAAGPVASRRRRTPGLQRASRACDCVAGSGGRGAAILMPVSGCIWFGEITRKLPTS